MNTALIRSFLLVSAWICIYILFIPFFMLNCFSLLLEEPGDIFAAVEIRHFLVKSMIKDLNKDQMFYAAVRFTNLFYPVLKCPGVWACSHLTAKIWLFKQGFTFVEVIAVRSQADAGVQYLHQLPFEFSNIQIKISENNVLLSIKDSLQEIFSF